MHQFPHSDKQKIFIEMQRIIKSGGLTAMEFYARSLNKFRYHANLEVEYKSTSIDNYLSHYPSFTDVREIVSIPHSSVPLQFAFARWVNRILGPSPRLP